MLQPAPTFNLLQFPIQLDFTNSSDVTLCITGVDLNPQGVEDGKEV